MADYEVVEEKSYEIEIKFIEGKLGEVKKQALSYLDKIGKGEKFSEEDVKEIQQMQKQTASIRDITKKIPLFGSLIEITADLTEILGRALKMMLENMKYFQPNIKSKQEVYQNKQGIELSDSIAKTEAETNQKQGQAQKQPQAEGSNEKLSKRSNYFGYEEEVSEENSKPQTQDFDEIKIQERLAKYNEDVKKRGEKSREAQSSEMESSEASFAPSKSD